MSASEVIPKGRPPRFDLNFIPRMKIGMGKSDAYMNGYRHGYEGVNSQHICCLTRGTDERHEWMRGYYEGATDRGGD